MKSAQRGPGTKMTPMEEVTLGALCALGNNDNTTVAVADALTYAQEYLSPEEQIPIPVSARTAGQYLGFLRTRGLVYCVPKAGVCNFRGQRRWFLVENG